EQSLALSQHRIRRALSSEQAVAAWCGAAETLREDGLDHRRVQPLGAWRLPLREHSGTAVGAGLSQAYLRRARVEVLRPGRNAPEERKVVAPARQPVDSGAPAAGPPIVADPVAGLECPRHCTPDSARPH